LVLTENEYSEYIANKMKQSPKSDSSIQDITGKKYLIPPIPRITYPGGVPIWPTNKNTTPEDLLKLSIEHQRFYGQFIKSFENARYIDLEGNVNYLIVLVHELALDFVLYGQEDEFEKELDKIEANYPEFKLKRPEVYKLVEIIEDNLEEFEDESEDNFLQAPFFMSSLALNLEDSLQLNLTEMKRVSQVVYKQNKFNQYALIQQQIVRLYLKVYELLEEAYNDKTTSLFTILEKIEDHLYNHDKFQTAEGGKLLHFNNYWSHHLFTRIFNQCENAIRKHYSYNDFIIPAGIFQYNYSTGKIKSINKWESKVLEIIQQQTANLEEPNEEYEKAFLLIKPSGWKTKYEHIINQYEKSPEQFLTAVLKLGGIISNSKNLINLYYQAYSYMLEKDTVTALTLYLHYLRIHQIKGTKNVKKISKIQESKLFQNKNQSEQFKELLNGLSLVENLQQTLDKLVKIFTAKRKEIILDTDSIQNIQKNHSQTVELLAELLQEEDEINPSKNIIAGQAESNNKIVQANPSNHSISQIGVSAIQKNTLEYIISNNFQVAVKKFEGFAREKGQFGNQLIESINELFYEQIGEILIEEEEGQYILHKELLKN
jgi:hypothetical protein